MEDNHSKKNEIESIGEIKEISPVFKINQHPIEIKLITTRMILNLDIVAY